MAKGDARVWQQFLHRLPKERSFRKFSLEEARPLGGFSVEWLGYRTLVRKCFALLATRTDEWRTSGITLVLVAVVAVVEVVVDCCSPRIQDLASSMTSLFMLLPITIALAGAVDWEKVVEKTRDQMKRDAIPANINVESEEVFPNLFLESDERSKSDSD